MRSAALLALLLAGCQTNDQMTVARAPMNKCDAVRHLLSSPTATPGETAAAMEAGRNHGCFGPAQPQTLQIR